ncbi:hypothetical protein [Dactylococcopsis salina]|uniref:hypothetical protein n=1 Tax=Dactylococcopsis salina TaxID=292566 RepID=UPI0002F41CD0|nr:hypothetical protein [Dactylococcopsis salina]
MRYLWRVSQFCGVIGSSIARYRLLENLTAELAAGSQVGESMLNLKVQSANPIDVGLAVNNYQSRTIGVWQQKLQLQHHK